MPALRRVDRVACGRRRRSRGRRPSRTATRSATPKSALGVGLVLGEEQLGGAVGAGARRRAGSAPSDGVLGDERRRASRARSRLRPVALAGAAPRPGVAEPERRQQVQRRRLGPAVGDGDADQDVVGRRLRVLGEDVEVAVVVEDAGVDQLELGLALAARGGSPRPAARTGTRAAGTCRAPSGTSASASRRGRSSSSFTSSPWLPSGPVRPNRRSFRIGSRAVPQREREAEPALAVADAEQAVLAPAVGAAARVVVREVVPARRRPRE